MSSFEKVGYVLRDVGVAGRVCRWMMDEFQEEYTREKSTRLRGVRNWRRKASVHCTSDMKLSAEVRCSF